MKRSLSACTSGIALAGKALTDRGWSLEHLAEQVKLEGKTGISKQTVDKFFKGRTVDRQYFTGICKTLGLDWAVVFGQTVATSQQNAPQNQTTPIEHSNIESLVQGLREQTRANIKQRCGTMRVLNMEQPIGVGSIYTNVNILEKISKNRQVRLQDLQADCDREGFDRFLLGAVKESRVPGVEAIRKFEQLMILGKPGAGKTTFMKHLAMQCMAGELQAHRLPMFVTLKEFAEFPDEPRLLDYLQEQLKVTEEVLCTLLGQGRAMVLLDGLDEVRDTDHDRILREIRSFANDFSNNQTIITCRIAAREYIFETFTEVEVADFDLGQIRDFVGKWFMQNQAKAQRCMEKIEEREPIQELASNPLLLTLLCLEFGESGDFPSSRSELYNRGIQVLLRRWDDTRNIERQQVYKDMSPKHKEDLLSYIAFHTFQNKEFFFKQQRVEKLIAEYITNLPGASNDPEALNLDSHALLKSICAHHGLLVERAREIYSFSHLTFHEYFTARYIKEDRGNDSIAVLLRHINSKNWREVFILTTEMLGKADVLLLRVKREIDKTLATKSSLQKYLEWLDGKASNIESDINPQNTKVFLFYLSLSLSLSLDISGTFDLSLSLDLSLSFSLDISGSLDRSLSLSLDRTLGLSLDFSLNIDSALNKKLEYLSMKLPDQEDIEAATEWWKANGKGWSEELRQVMIEHRNIGHDWQFSDNEKQLLRRYFQAYKLLADCLDSECYIDRSVREEIEATFMRPIAQIEQWKANKAKESTP